MPGSRPRRLLRNSKACDYCHKRRIKCQANPLDPLRCQNCADFDIACVFTRPWKRAKSAALKGAPGAPAGTAAPAAQIPQSDAQHGRDPASSRGRAEVVEGSSSVQELDLDRKWDRPLSPAWQRFARASTPAIRRLLSLYQEIVQPIFPFLDAKRLEQRLDTLEHAHSRPFFSTVMAACAITSARLRDGALRSSVSGSDSPELRDILPETYYSAAEEALQEDLLHCHHFDHLRGYALMAVASIQDAQIAAMQKYIGQYFTIMAMNQWHDESCWPQDLQPGEIEERRRVYWSMYTLDVFSAIVWDGCIHFQEGHAKVGYPSAGDGEPVDGVHWIVGWNFTTDLYRILEHELGRLRSRSSKFADLGRPRTTWDGFSTSSQDFVNDLYSALPGVFKQLQPATGDPGRDIYGFQAANIQATIALLRMVHLSVDHEKVDLEKKCSVASDVLSIFHQVPKPYLRAISTPLVYHIGGIGTILGSVMEGPLSHSSCLRVRDLLLSMADLLDGLEAFLHRSAGTGQSIRQLASRIGEYMNSQIRLGQAEGGAERSSEVVPEAASSAWDNVVLNDLSPQFQLPEELLQDWTWPFTMSSNYLSFQPL